MHIRFFMNLIFFPQAPSDIPFAPGPILSPQYVVGTQHMLDEEDEHEGDHGKDMIASSCKGPLNSTTAVGQVNNKYMFVNTNSFMGAHKDKAALDTAELDENAHSMVISESMQRAVVGAWLLVKEASTLLVSLATLTASKYNLRSLRNQQAVEGNEISYLSTHTINELGLSLLDGLGRLKHMGAISESHNALQILCEGLLRIGGKSPHQIYLYSFVLVLNSTTMYR